jgi:hypothetical protein
MTTTQTTDTHPGRLDGEIVTLYTTNGGVAAGRAWTYGPSYPLHFQGFRVDGTPMPNSTTISPHRVLRIVIEGRIGE